MEPTTRNQYAILISESGTDITCLNKPVNVVGRRRFVCDVVVDVPCVSKLHCLIFRTVDGYVIRDLGSSNGTQLNGQQVMEALLAHGDEIAFDAAVYRFEMRSVDQDDGGFIDAKPADLLTQTESRDSIAAETAFESDTEPGNPLRNPESDLAR